MIRAGGGKFRPSLFRESKSKRDLEQSERLILNYVFSPMIPHIRNTIAPPPPSPFFLKVPFFTRLPYRLELHVDRRWGRNNGGMILKRKSRKNSGDKLCHSVAV